MIVLAIYASKLIKTPAHFFDWRSGTLLSLEISEGVMPTFAGVNLWDRGRQFQVVKLRIQDARSYYEGMPQGVDEEDLDGIDGVVTMNYGIEFYTTDRELRSKMDPWVLAIGI